MKKYQLRKMIQIVFIGIWILLILYIIPEITGTCHQFCSYAAVCFGAMSFRGYAAYLPIVIIGLLIAVSTLFWGRIFCGYVCFLGSLQEYLYGLNKSKQKFSQRIPYKIHRFLKLIKYLVFVFTLATAYFAVQYIYMKYCPVVAISHLTQIGVAAVIVLAVIIAGGILAERFWCRYLCPYAALMNIFQYLGRLLKIKRKKIFRNIKTSINCFNCANYCPMNIDIGYNEEVSDVNCIQCHRCVRICSKKEADKSKCIYRD